MTTTYVPIADLTARVAAIFERHGTAPRNAVVLAETCVGAERDGSLGHGLFRLPGYCASLSSGWVDGRAVPTVALDPGSGILRVDARNGFAQPALRAAASLGIARARAGGLCGIAIRDSHHFGTLWQDIEPFAREGLIAIACVNSVSRVVPPGGREPVYGTNPIAFACPRAASFDPLVFDQASSAMAFGEIRLAAREGQPLPPGVAVDRHGVPTTDAAAVLAGGALLPFGGYKGASIALMVELLSAGLTGGSFSFEVDMSSFHGAQTPRTGEFVLLIDPVRAGAGDFARRTEHLLARLGEAGQERFPGDRRYAARREALARGIPISADMLALLSRLEEAVGQDATC